MGNPRLVKVAAVDNSDTPSRRRMSDTALLRLFSVQERPPVGR